MITPTTELEAVNTLLRAIGESPVSSLNGDVGVDVVSARSTLHEISTAVQVEGWDFNTEYDYPLARNVEHEIVVPVNALSVDIDRRKYPMIDPVIRGKRVYDRKNHTYKFDQGLTARIIFGLGFDELPQSARYYITYRAARKFQDNHLGSSELHQYNEKDEYRARAVFLNDRAEDENLNFLANNSFFKPMLGS